MNSELTIVQCMVSFIDFKRFIKKLSEKSLTSYEGEINRLIRFLPNGPLTPIREVTAEVIEQYFAYANTEKRKWEDHPFNNSASTTQIGLKATTVNNMRRYLNTFFNFLVSKHIVESNPMKNIEKITEDELGYGCIPEKGEIWRLVKQPNQKTFNGYRDVTLIQVLVDTAMRLGQCLGLHVDDLILEKRLIHIRPEITKTRKSRYVAITEGTAFMLKNLIESMDSVTNQNFPWLWITDQGTKLSGSTFSKQLDKYALKAGLDPKRIHPHMLRHYSAVQHRLNGASVDQIQALLDHAQIETTMRYLRHFEHDMLEINSKYSPAHDLFQKPGRKAGKTIIQWSGKATAAFSENIVTVNSKTT